MDSLTKNPSLGNKTRFEPGAFEIQDKIDSAVPFRSVQNFICATTGSCELLEVNDVDGRFGLIP
jgi:hypothetical protein